MIRKITLLFLACLGMSSLSYAQKCGFDEIHLLKMQTDPEYASAINKFNTDMAAWLNAKKNIQALPTILNGNKVYEIPVVVHVVYPSGAPLNTLYNPSDATITNMINYLSQAFQASYTGLPFHLPEASGGVRIPIVFKLAQRTPYPNCNATNGIVRIDGSTNATYNSNGVGTPGISDNALKALSYWPNTEYYNIWVVHKIDGANMANPTPGGTKLGYALFPPTGVSASDGTVMLADQVSQGNLTITHELGHAFFLYHVFGADPNGQTCFPDVPDCYSAGDFCCDTKPTKWNLGGCPVDIPTPTPPNTCNPPSMTYDNVQHNIMDYSNCKDRFTPDQRERVWNAMVNTGYVRSSLLSSLGSTAPSTPPIAATCNPTGPANPFPNNLGPRRVTVIKKGASIATDSVIMSAVSGSFSGDGNIHYFDRTCSHRLELEAGKQYDINVTVGPNSEFVRAFIDYNNNGVFTDAGETIYTPGSGTFIRPTMTFTVPATGAVNCQPLRMRVISNDILPNPCPVAGIDGQAEDYEVIIRGSGAATSTPGLATIIQPPLGGNPSCSGSGVTVAATYLNTITPIWYQWFKKNGTTITPFTPGTDSFITRNNWAHLDTVWAKVAYPGLCGIDTTLTDSITLYRPDNITPTVTINITKGTIPGCPDDTLRFTVTGNVNPGGSPSYQWYVNGNPAGTNQPVLDTFNLPNNSTIQVRMNSSAGSPCADPGFAMSNTLVYIHGNKAPTLSIALISGTNPGCPNQALTFLATGTTTGPTPTYEWQVNSSTVQTGASNTYTGVLNNNDVVSCIMTSSTSCAVPSTATSTNTITITHTPLVADVTIQQIKGNSPACTGHEMVFVATPTNSGANPQFQWLVNNTPVAGANSPVFSTYSLLNGDFVSCILISTDPCVANTFDTSTILPMVITTSKTPSVTVAITKGNNPGCLDSLVEFTATDKDLGTSPNFDWLVNGFQTFNGQVFSTTNLLNGDVVTCRANQTDGGCYLPDTVTSAPITMVRSTTPEPPIISLVNNNLVTNKTGSFIWFGPAGQLTGGENGSFHPTELGQYYCVTNNNGCWSKPSNKLTITLLDISTYNISEVSIYPNPTTGRVELDWGGRRVNMKVSVYSTVGQKLMDSDVKNQSHSTLDLGKLANGIYFIVVTDEQGKSGTARITVTK